MPQHIGTLCFSDINISQSSVATPVRCGGICNDLFIANFLLSVTVKEFLKNDNTFVEISTMVYTAYFFEPPCTTCCTTNLPHRNAIVFTGRRSTTLPEPNTSTCQDVGMWQISVRWW